MLGDFRRVSHGRLAGVRDSPGEVEMSRRASRAICGVLLGTLLVLSGCGAREPATKGAPPTVRLLTEAQYRNIIADVFGKQIEVAGRFDPIVRTEGLLAVGAGLATVTPSGVERYVALARSIAKQALASPNRELLVPCRPVAKDAEDPVCARQFLGTTGRYLFRRAITEEELAAVVNLAGDAARARRDFHAGLEIGLQSLLASPDFLFVTENATRDPRTGALKLDGPSRATRLSFFLWNSMPDEALLQAAEQGRLDDAPGVEAQVERMLRSPRIEHGVRALFTDMWALDDFATLEKDPTLFPAFGLAAANDAREQVLRTLVDTLLVRDADYREVFTTRKTFMTGALGIVYRVPVSMPGEWSPFEFERDDPRVGVQTQLAFLALHSHAGKSSPTLRGKAVRELLLCQRVPDPPSTVNFDRFNDPASPGKTARARLQVHSTEPSCAGCHRLMDPIGLALENFDGAGQWRDDENGESIDIAGELNGTRFADTAGLGAALADDPAAPACLVRRTYSYALGRAVQRNERKFMTYLDAQFARDRYRLPALLRRIATSEAFLKVSTPALQTAGSAAREGSAS